VSPHRTARVRQSCASLAPRSVGRARVFPPTGGGEPGTPLRIASHRPAMRVATHSRSLDPAVGLPSHTCGHATSSTLYILDLTGTIPTEFGELSECSRMCVPARPASAPLVLRRTGTSPAHRHSRSHVGWGIAQNCGLERVDGISADGAGPPDNYSGTVRGAFTVHTRLSCHACSTPHFAAALTAGSRCVQGR
jgi:hypothetical protein